MGADIEGDDVPTILDWFDETAAAVFAVHARLTGGDRTRAASLLIATFRELHEAGLGDLDGAGPDRDVGRSAARGVNRRAMIDLAHRVYLRRDPGQAGGRAGDRVRDDGLRPVERVVASLTVIEHCSADEVGRIIGGSAGISTDAVSVLVAAARQGLADIRGDDPERALRRGEIWFDDSLRADARGAVLASVTAAPARRADEAPMHSSQARPDQAGGRRRRVAATVAAIVAVVIAAGVWRSSADGRAGSAGPTTSAVFLPPPTDGATVPDRIGASDTTATTATTDTNNTVDTVDTSEVSPAAADGGFLIDPLPAGYIALGARTIDRTDDATGLVAGWFDLWSAADATRTTGRWLAVLVVPNQPYRLTIAPRETSSRTTVGNDHGLLWTDTDGVRRLTVDLAGHGVVEYESFGFSDGDLVRLAGDVTLSNVHRPRYGTVAASLLDTLSVQISRPAAQSTFDEAVFVGAMSGAIAYYRSDVGIAVVMTTVQEANDLLAAALLSTAPITVAGDHPLVIGVLPEELLVTDRTQLTAFVRRHVGDRTVTVFGTASREVLIALAAATRAASPEEWQALVDTPRQVDTTPDPTVAVSQATIGTSRTIDGSEWTIDLSDESGGLVMVTEQRAATRSTDSALFEGAAGEVPLVPPADQTITEFNTPDARLVIITFTQQPRADTVVVTVGDERATVVPIVQVGDLSLWGAAIATDAVGSATAVLADS